MSRANVEPLGVKGVRAECLETACRHVGLIPWKALPFPAQMSFPAIVATGRLKCARCGSRRVTIMPDWSGYKPQGGG